MFEIQFLRRQEARSIDMDWKKMLPVKFDRPTQTRVSRPRLDLQFSIFHQAEGLSAPGKSDRLGRPSLTNVDQSLEMPSERSDWKTPTDELEIAEVALGSLLLVWIDRQVAPPRN